MNTVVRWALLSVILVGTAYSFLMVSVLLAELGFWSHVKYLNDGAGQILTFLAAAFAIGFTWREYRIRNSPQLTVKFDGFSNDNDRILRCIAENTNTYPVLVTVESVRFDGADQTPEFKDRAILRGGAEVLKVIRTHVIPDENGHEIEVACAIESAVPPYHRALLTFAAKLSSPDQFGPPVADVSEFRLVPLPRRRRKEIQLSRQSSPKR